MIQQKTGGSIICISSTAGHRATFPQTATAYVCSKHAVLGLVRQAGAELAQYNIRVNSISPGYAALVFGIYSWLTSKKAIFDEDVEISH